MDQEDLLEILAVSRKNNKLQNLTGMLLYGEGTFIQVLEGDDEILKRTYKSIEHDTRHKNIIKMAEGEVTERNFPEWSMGFKAVNVSELKEFGGYINPKNKNFLSEDNTNVVMSMLKTFADANRMSDNY